MGASLEDPYQPSAREDLFQGQRRVFFYSASEAARGRGVALPKPQDQIMFHFLLLAYKVISATLVSLSALVDSSLNVPMASLGGCKA